MITSASSTAVTFRVLVATSRLSYFARIPVGGCGSKPMNRSLTGLSTRPPHPHAHYTDAPAFGSDTTSFSRGMSASESTPVTNASAMLPPPITATRFTSSGGGGECPPLPLPETTPSLSCARDWRAYDDAKRSRTDEEEEEEKRAWATSVVTVASAGSTRTSCVAPLFARMPVEAHEATRRSDRARRVSILLLVLVEEEDRIGLCTTWKVAE